MITIKRIHIKNFRSVVDEMITLKDLNCFVGLNDSGKSNVLKALNLFFNGETDFDTPLDFENDYSKLAKRGQKQAKEIIVELDIVIPDTFKEKGIKRWKKVWRSEGVHQDNLSELFSAGSKGLTFLSRIQYLYIPAVKSNEYFRGLLSNVYLSMTQTANSALKDLNEQYSNQLQALTVGLTQQLRSVLKMDSAIQMPSNLSTLFRDLTFSTSDQNVGDISLEHRGDGIKARHIPSILQFIQKNTEDARPKKSISGSYIWGFEEPENGVEYLSCFEMAQEFLLYAKSCQILTTTHSPAFYTLKSNENVACFLTNKRSGCSKYIEETEEKINERMGLLQMVAPFIQAVKEQYEKDINEQSTAYSNLAAQLNEVMNIMNRANEQLDAKQVLSVIERYSAALDMLDDYDLERLEKPDGTEDAYKLSYEECKSLISKMRFSAESDLFGNEKDDSFKGSIGNIYSTFAGVDLYPSVEEKAANLLYFITKNHSFSGGNKRIAGAVFLYFLDKNGLLFSGEEKIIADHTLVAIIVMIAESKPEEKDTMVKLVMNFLKQ